MSKDFLQLYIQGNSNKKYYSIYLESENFAIIKFKGGSYWSGMYGTKYCKSIYTLIKKGSTTWSGYRKYIHEGRLTNQDKINFNEILNNHEGGLNG
ncbi:MAG: hypothetical protein M0R03_20875 [Novosphingobium sp.]|nr:hypothetical protein [Novosphingobium sp.]